MSVNNTSTKKGMSILHNILISIGILYIFISVLILSSVIRMSIEQACFFSYTYIAYFIIYIISNKNLDLMSIDMLIIYYMGIQAFGYPLALLIDYENTYTKLMREKFFYGVYLDKYVALSILAISSIIIGMAVYEKLFVINKYKDNITITNEAKKFQCSNNNVINYYYIIGKTLLALFCIYMLANLVAGNIPLNNYNAYKIWAGNRMRSYLQIGYWFGVIFVICSSSKRKLLFPIILFSIPSLILVAAGNRNDILYPLIISLGIYNFRFNKIPKLIFVFIIIFVLIISPMISSTRVTGIEFEVYGNITKLIASSLREFGSQLRPISHMFLWLDYGENFAYGGTYFFASLAAIFGVIDPTYSDIFRRSRFCIDERLPTLAFTMSGEIYFNFGIFGVIIIYLIIGYKMKKKEEAQLNVDEMVKYAFYCFSLLHLVRNQFSSYITVIIIFYMLYIFEKVIRAILKSIK